MRYLMHRKRCTARIWNHRDCWNCVQPGRSLKLSNGSKWPFSDECDSSFSKNIYSTKWS